MESSQSVPSWGRHMFAEVQYNPLPPPIETTLMRVRPYTAWHSLRIVWEHHMTWARQQLIKWQNSSVVASLSGPQRTLQLWAATWLSHVWLVLTQNTTPIAMAKGSVQTVNLSKHTTRGSIPISTYVGGISVHTVMLLAPYSIELHFDLSRL